MISKDILYANRLKSIYCSIEQCIHNYFQIFKSNCLIQTLSVISLKILILLHYAHALCIN